MRLTNLHPNTIYEYKVGDTVCGKWSDEYSFKTRPFGALPTSFWTVPFVGFAFIFLGLFPFTAVTFADFDTANEITKNKTVMARLRENLSEFDFILEFGDITYADGDQMVLYITFVIY